MGLEIKTLPLELVLTYQIALALFNLAPRPHAFYLSRAFNVSVLVIYLVAAVSAALYILTGGLCDQYARCLSFRSWLQPHYTSCISSGVYIGDNQKREALHQLSPTQCSYIDFYCALFE